MSTNPTTPAPPLRRRRPRAPGLVTAYEKLVDGLADLRSPGQLDLLAASVRATVARIERGCQACGTDPADLPRPSANALQALRDLALPGNLERAGDCMVAARAAFTAVFAEHHPREQRPIVLRVRRTSTLWRVRTHSRHIDVILTDRLLGAPESVLRLLAAWCLGKDHGRARRVIEAWLTERRASGPAVTRGAPGARGRAYDLDELFDELNRDYFHGQLARPQLTWTSRPTVRKLGHYTFADDCVVLSSSLDDPSVPRFAVNYVLYHELLHKQLGSSGAARGRRTHGVAFRRREAQFADYERALTLLDELGARWRRARRARRLVSGRR